MLLPVRLPLNVRCPTRVTPAKHHLAFPARCEIALAPNERKGECFERALREFCLGLSMPKKLKDYELFRQRIRLARSGKPCHVYIRSCVQVRSEENGIGVFHRFAKNIRHNSQQKIYQFHGISKSYVCPLKISSRVLSSSTSDGDEAVSCRTR